MSGDMKVTGSRIDRVERIRAMLEIRERMKEARRRSKHDDETDKDRLAIEGPKRSYEDAE
ncbi:hypothetical protein [Afifella marina]|uniref:Uncharacterized protein n=1 Tax=Afifella marina DSM 2698 TaxID=1120955 RepID=A0A1G5MKU8_AFIMA|nr:hypothetical protein [Afifella marina]MBK1623883.1 hypothetical protein [Afifella marina DSM 2698]MBK1627201.1 hypothetical protein [Afifella marina]MBK5918770.1 hypothetical protein [Afifella marina]RAI22621.1 hypothetical protein CH311_02830 [Afifella marina DSM 2698]SCZ25796.1 hypothetical protein SAMN03080610_00853 [Afifella marina DSM 2698]